MVMTNSVQLGLWRGRIALVLENCADKIPDVYAMTLEITMNEIDAAIRHEEGVENG